VPFSCRRLSISVFSRITCLLKCINTRTCFLDATTHLILRLFEYSSSGEPWSHSTCK
jgi:hypothetical protein